MYSIFVIFFVESNLTRCHTHTDTP